MKRVMEIVGRIVRWIVVLGTLLVIAIGFVELRERIICLDSQQVWQVSKLDAKIVDSNTRVGLLMNDIDNFRKKIEELEQRCDELEDLIYSDVTRSTITGIIDSSKLEKDELYPERHFEGNITLSWDKVPNASGYQIEFSHQPETEETDSAYFYHTGAFYSNDEEISQGIQFRIRAYALQGDKKVYGIFSEWKTIEIE